ncbi:MAG: DUF3489 domain-containing protein [Bryobacterales bacterium]|nr:DUF3489 domain-containing protein [Bryobacterales bacterium]
MTTFTIDTDNTITAYAAGEAIPAGQARFTTEKELAKLASQWPVGRFVEIWNSFAGVPPFGDLKPVKKFTDRKTAVARIWHTIQALTPPAAPQAAPDASKKAKATKGSRDGKQAVPAKTRHIDLLIQERDAKARAKREAKPQSQAREGSKKAQVLDLLRRQEGATLADIMTATGWQAHSVRGFISGALTKKMGLAVESYKSESGDRAYRIA